MERMKTRLKRVFLFMLSALMLFTSLPLSVFAKVDYDNLTDNKSEIVNKLTPVKPAKPAENQTAKDLIENQKQPAIYTLRTDYKVQRGEKYQVDYQPYIASVGELATADEQKKVDKLIKLPDLAGYEKPEGQENFKIDYKTVKDAADGKNKTGNDVNGFRYSANKEFNYSAKSNKIKIKHVFQDLEDFTKYTNPDGSVGDETALIITQNGNTGSTLQASALSESDPRRKGFIPEAEYINMQVPENAENFILEYRYNRAHYDVVFDTQGGTAVPARTLYYEQKIPKINNVDQPTKVGGNFLGWKPSVDLKGRIEGVDKTFKAGEIIKDSNGNPILGLDANLIMPASKVTFTAVWKDKEKADYAVQFWAEKADHADGASLADKYDYIGTRVYKDKDTGTRPDLDNEPVKDIVFTDLDKARLAKIWAGARFNRGKDLYLNKFYVYNQALTHDQNKDPENVNLVKSVDSTGKTVYNIYYDRQVYDLYFTKSNAQPAGNTFYPEIWGYDEAKGEVVKKGGPGNPYHYKARFNQLMLGWPNDAMQTKGFTPGYQSFGWGPNYTKANWPGYLDTPPYRLNADEFLDMKNYDTWGGYAKPIDKGDGTSIDVDRFDFKTLSFGINQSEGSMPHHMDFWMDGFKDDETIIRYDLYRFKADTNSESYAPKYPKVQGFTGKRDKEPAEFLDEAGIYDKNDERKEVTPFPTKTYTVLGDELPIGKMKFISVFFSNADDWGDAIDGDYTFDKNGYLKFEYSRNKYPLRFNYDPAKIKGDNEFGPTNQLQTFYEFPLKALSPDLAGNEEYKKDNPANLLDNPEKLKELKLTDLIFTDPKDGKLKVKRPDNLSDQMVFKGWALDPAGTKLIWENPGEKMPNHPLNLYAKWGEPDYKWKVTFDPNGGKLSSIDEAKVTQKRKTIQEGDIGQIEKNTYAKKEANDGDKQVFTVIQRQKLVEPKFKPTKKGYDFMGWEIIHYKKNEKGDYTDKIDNSYRETYKVPELYSFGNDVIAPVYLKAIWVPNDRVDVDVVHHFLSLDLSKETKPPVKETLHNKRTGYLVAASGDKQNEKYILANHEELEQKLPDDLKALYKEYNDRVKANNTYFQTFKVEPEKIPDPNDSSKMIENPKFKDNVFHFFYRPFRTRDYKVNYIDERGKAEVEKFFKGLNLTDTSGLKDDALLKANEENNKKFEDKRTDFEKLIKEYQIVNPEAVSNGNRHYDARNYRQIPGWVLAKDEKPQQQLVFDVNEGTNEFLGINGTGVDQVFFYYKDVRVIEVPGDKEPPKGYVRVTFKAEKGGAFTDKDGNSKTELYYDVIKGLKSDLLPEPKELEEGKTKEEGKYYITPETGKKFIKWDEKPLLNKNTIVDNDTKDFYVFTAKFEWSGLSASGIVRTEAYKDSNGKWTNDFAPKIEDLKKQLVWMEKGAEKPLPTGAVIKLYDEAGNELTTDDQVYKLVNEKNKADKDELVRTVNVKAKVTFTDGKEPQELTIPITVYKNVYEALNKAGDKPLFLTEAEKKEAKDGGLKDILKDNTENRYIKVTIKPNKDFTNKDDKVYYVNPNAWVEIPVVETDGSSGFINWTADKKAQNEGQAENGVFDFGNRHKFTEDTVIKPVDATDVVEQTDPNKKPDVPKTYVKVVVDLTDKAKLDANEKQTRTFWVKRGVDVTIPVTKPLGKNVKVSVNDPKEFTWTFSKWTSDDSPVRTWSENVDTGIRAQFTKEETKISANYIKDIIAQGTVIAEEIEAYESTKGINVFIPKESDLKTKVKVIGANGYATELPTDAKLELVLDTAYADLDAELYDKLKEKDNANDEPTRIEKVKAKVTFANGEVQEVDIPIKVIKNIYEAKTLAEKPYYVPKDYVRVILNPTSLATDPQKTCYYVNPKAKVIIPGEDPTGVGDSKFIKWTMKADDASGKGADYDLKARHQFEKASTITAQYSADVVPQEGNTKPEGVPDNFVEVKFVPTDKAQDTTEKIYWVNPAVAVKIPVENPKGTQYYTFKEWKMGANADGAVYNPGTSKKFTDALTVITATYEETKNIIPYDPSATDPKPRPDGYVRVSFATEDGLKLTKEKAYYVKKNAGIKLGNSELAKPGYKAETGYEFDKWDKEDSLEIADQDVLVTAKATVLKDVDTVKHPGYVKVTFVAGDNGVIKENGNKIDEKVYYVNPNKYVNLPAPTPDGNTGYDFGAWKSDKSQSDFSLANFVNFKEDTTITAMFNQKEAVYPKLKGSTKPAGYVEVTFKVTGTDGKIADNEITTYYVDPNRQVSLKAPKTIAGTGFIFDKWRLGTNPTDQIIKPADQRQYSKDTTIYGSFTKLKDIIPATNDDGTPNLQPIDYVAVLFIGGDHANKLDGQILYYVNPNANPAQTIGNLTKPKVTPDVGWKQKAGPDAWDVKDTTVIKDYIFVVAQYDPIDDVVPALKDDGTPNEKPAGYVKVTFKAGANGTLQGGEKTYFVNPNKYVKLTPPTTVPNTSYEFSTWCSDGKEFILANNINYTKNTIITAMFNPIGNIIPEKNPNGTTNTQPVDFVKVTFTILGQGGQIETGENITYFVKKNTDLTIHPPKTTANTGYEFEKWSIDTTEAKQYTADTTVKGEFKKLEEIIPSKNPDGTVNAKPEGYVIVNFLKGDHGVLDGRTTFYVNPKAGKKLKDLDISGITVVPSPTYKFDKWDMAMDTLITGPNNINVTAEYSQLPNIIKAGPKDTAPDGYVVIIFETDGRGTITGNKAYEKTPPASKENEIVYFVNPKKGIKLAKLDSGVTPAADQLAIPSTTPNDPDKYIFDQWRTDIDTETPITRGRVHIAMFKPKEVKLTYDANKATGTVPAELTVDYNTDVRLAGKGDLAKKDASFKGWKIGDKIYQAGDQINLKEDTTATAQWDDDKKIIEYNPVDNPTTRPDDSYVRVTFAADDGLKLTEQKAYYVKKDAGITLGDTELAKPAYKEETGYKFDKWDQKDTLEIKTDIVVKATSTSLPDFDTKAHPNYVQVTFKAGANGTVTETTYYVNPNKYVKLTPPTATGNTGYEFASWSQDATIPTVYTKNLTIITASFNGLNDVIPKINPDGTENKKPDGYKTVTFVIEPATGGKIVDKEVTVYYVNPAKEVTVSQPKTQAETGYEFEKWNPDTTVARTYTENTTVKGNFKTLADIIPAIDDAGKTNAKPEGYVKVRFVSSVDGNLYETKGGNKKAIDDKVYYVNPKTNQVIGSLTKPEADPNVGFEKAPTLWRILGSANGSTTTKLDETKITDDMTLIAEYKPLADVIEKKKDDDSDRPNGYITVKFSTEANGKISGTDKTIKELYINPLKQPIVLRGQDPDVNPNTGYLFSGWDKDINTAIKYNDGDIIKAQYTERENIYTAEKPGYVKVVFKAGDNGALEGLTELWVKPGVAVELPQPKVDPKTGYNFEKWDKDTKVTLQASATPYEITAMYETIAEFVPGDQAQPKGYVKVEFKADENGTLSGTTVYYVNPEKEVDLTSQANGIAKKPNIGYTADSGTWRPVIESKKYTSDAEYKFNFVKLEKIGDKEHPGYVKVEFIAGENGELEGGNKTYYVNPLEGIKPGSKELPIPEPKAKQNYVFDSWYEAINKDEPITKDKTFVARFKLNKVTLTYEAQDKTSGKVPEKLSYDIGTEITLAGGNDLKKDNYVLTGWDIDGTTYAPGAKYKITKNTIAKAVWDTDFHKVDFDTDGGTFIKSRKIKHDGLLNNVKSPEKEGYTFTGWKVNGKAFDLANDKVTNDITLVAKYVKNVVEQTDRNKKPDVPIDFVRVIVKTTEKATDTTAFEKTFWVAPNKHVTIPVVNPIGRDMPRDGDKAAFTYVFTKWTSEDNSEWEVKIGGSFDRVTTITAQYDEKPAIPGDLLAETYYTSESLKDGDKFINNYLPNVEELKALIRVRDDEGNPVSLNAKDKIEFVPGEKANGTPYESLDEEIYDKLKENGLGDLEEISRTEKIKAKVTFANGTVNEVEIPIVVYKNIYEGLTNKGDKPKYVAQAKTDLDKSNLVDTDYVRVTLIPTAKAKNQQRKTYYVRKNASVIIPEIKAEGRDAYEFIYWKAVKPGEGQDNPNYGWATRSMSMFRSAATAAKNDLVDNNEKVNFDGRMSFDDNTDIVAQYKTPTPTPTPDEPDKPNPDYPKYPDKPNPDYPNYPEYRPNYSGGSTIYIEKPVEKVIKVPDNAFVKEVRYMQGFEGKFRPFDGLTRAEAAQILANALKEDGYKYDPNYKISYKDIGNAWYTEAVKIVTQANVFKGYDDGNFKPQEKITRAEWIGTLKRFQELRDLSGNHMNLREGHWAMAEIEAAYQAGWLAIYSDGLADFKADEFIPRQEVAAVSNKAFERVLDKTYIKRNDKALVNYKDINDKMWSYEDILCASNTFLHDKKLYRAHGIDMSNEIFNINLDGFTITKDKFQRIER